MGARNSTRADVARLLGRAGFGATAAELDEWTGKPYADLVEHLLDVPQPPLRPPLPDDAERVAIEQTPAQVHLGIGFGPVSELARAQRWWLNRMATTLWPLEERLTLLWHDHFATAAKDFGMPTVAMVVAQTETLRRHSLGNFRAMVDAITLDPAMLWWLDGRTNAIPEPNENYAREFLELFTLGKSPQVYTERDIREAARAFTGWTVDPFVGTQPRFEPGRHDRGRKTILRRTVNDLGDREYRALTEIALAQPVAPRFVAYKLVTGLAYLPPKDNLLTRPDPLVKQVADELVRGKWDLRRAVRTLLLSDWFRYASPPHSRQVVREPAVLVAAAARSLGLQIDHDRVPALLATMGQQLFRPPNVGGWPKATEWFSPATMLARYALGLELSYMRYAPAGAGFATAETFPRADDLAGWTRLLGLAGLSSTTQAAISGYLARTRSGVPEQQRRETVLALLLASPDWMVM